jgi:DNA-binding response OmpR family regulator
MTLSRVLLVDDHDEISAVFQEGLENYGFEVVMASTVRRALRLITSEQFAVLLYDLHTADASDAFVVVNALLHVHPDTVLLVLSRYPALQGGLSALLLKPDEILLKPVRIGAITERIRKMLENPPVHRSATTENVAAILQRDLETTIHSWIRHVERSEELCGVDLGYAHRTAHLANLFHELLSRLRSPSEASAPLSTTAHAHGMVRRHQGYTAAMLVEESRILQRSIFQTLEDNLRCVDFSKVLVDIRTIADEVNSQLKQQILGYMSSKPARSAAA